MTTTMVLATLTQSQRAMLYFYQESYSLLISIAEHRIPVLKDFAKSFLQQNPLRIGDISHAHSFGCEGVLRR